MRNTLGLAVCFVAFITTLVAPLGVETKRQNHSQCYLIKVDKRDNLLVLFENNVPILTFRTSCGISNCTPVGRFRIISKSVTDPSSELGSRFLGLNCWNRRTGRQYGIHGTNRPDLIGKSVSRGCVRMRNEDIEVLFKVVPIGTVVLISNDFPDIPLKRVADRAHNVWKVAGHSVEGREIRYVVLGKGENLTLIIAGIHGDEILPVQFAYRLVAYLQAHPGILAKAKVIIVPQANPDGVARRTRTNARGVDINRNFPTKDWNTGSPRGRYARGPKPMSEPETRAIVKLINEYRPDKIISIHSPLHQVNYDGPAQEIAKLMARYNGYKVTSNIGYKTPGSLGTYAGKEQGIPVITLELPNSNLNAVWSENCKALLAAIKFAFRARQQNKSVTKSSPQK